MTPSQFIQLMIVLGITNGILFAIFIVLVGIAQSKK